MPSQPPIVSILRGTTINHMMKLNLASTRLGSQDVEFKADADQPPRRPLAPYLVTKYLGLKEPGYGGFSVQVSDGKIWVGGHSMSGLFHSEWSSLVCRY